MSCVMSDTEICLTVTGEKHVRSKRKPSHPKVKQTITQLIAMIDEVRDDMDFPDDLVREIRVSQKHLHFFDSVEDFRDPNKIEYKLSEILLMTFLIMMERGTSVFTEIADYIEAEQYKFRDIGLLQGCSSTPSHDTIRRVFMGIKAEQIGEITIQAFRTFLDRLERSIKTGKKQLVAFDGKEVRGTGRAENTQIPARNISFLNVYLCGSYLCLASEYVDKKTNEIPVAQELLKSMNLKGMILTADALHCQTDTCEIIRKAKGHYVLTCKTNQKSLYQEIHSRMENNLRKVIKVDRGDRVFFLYYLPKSYNNLGFTGLTAFVMMFSFVRSSTATEHCFITSLKNDIEIIEAIEGRWGAESDLHKAKDAIMHEDDIRYTNVNAVHAMAYMNNMIVTLMKLYQVLAGKRSLAHARAWVRANPLDSLAGMLALTSSEEIITALEKELARRARKNK